MILKKYSAKYYLAIVFLKKYSAKYIIRLLDFSKKYSARGYSAEIAEYFKASTVKEKTYAGTLPNLPSPLGSSMLVMEGDISVERKNLLWKQSL